VQRSAGDVEVLRAATRRLLRTVDDLTDEQAREPSRLPDWNRAEVLTHIARNADGTREMVEAATRGDVVAQYPGGIEQRRADIAAGRDVRAADLLLDLRRSSDRLMEAYAELPDDAWDRVGKAISGERTMGQALWSRRREVEVHHVDLGLGYEASDWPVGFVSEALAEIFSTFDRRSSPTRPLLDADYRVVSTDHDHAWRIELRGTRVKVTDDTDRKDVEGEGRGWGCDVAAWLYGRDPRGGGIIASGDLTVLRLPQWFPFA
jgi:maleylpyruvate isomerase